MTSKFTLEREIDGRYVDNYAVSQVKLDKIKFKRMLLELLQQL
jgi:hypothetical protein